jgi:predicted permease
MKLLRKIRALFRKDKLDADMSEEMRLHLEQRTAENVAAGMSAAEARYAALRKFGGVEQVKEQARDVRGWPWVEAWVRDLRQAVRTLGRSPGFSLSVFLTLVLCLGPNTAVLSALYTLVLKPLPFPAPQQLVLVKNISTNTGNSVGSSGYPQYLDFTQQADRFERFALFEMANTTIGEEGVPTRAAGYRATASLFDLLRVQPLLGRFFLADEEATGRDHVLVLTYSFWQKQYDGNPAAVGREVRMGGEMFTIVGVAPPTFEELFLRVDFLRPFQHGPEDAAPDRRFASRATLVGRLKPGVTLPQAQAQLGGIEERYRTAVASPAMRTALEKAGMRIAVQPWRKDILSVAPAAKPALWTLEAAALFVLLIGCVNVANLMLARVNVKRTELAVRMALGAGWAAVFRQMFCEVLLLTSAAAVAGIAAGWGTLQWINHSVVVQERYAPPLHIHAGIAAVVLIAGFGIALLVGSLPLVPLRRAGLRLDQSRGASASGGMRFLSSTLIVGQVALALVLLIGSGLLIRSFAKVMAVNPGFDAEHVVQGRVALSHIYDEPTANAAIRQRLIDAMKEIPGVDSVGCSSYFGVGPASSYRAIPYTVRRTAPTTTNARPTAYLHPVSEEFFAAMGTRLLAGRNFMADDDGQRGGLGLIVDRAFAERNFPGRSALGEEVAFGAGPFPENFQWPRIVGVVDRANVVGLEERDGLPFIYVLMGRQQTSPGFNLLVSSRRPTGEILAAMREKLHAIDPTLPLYNAATLRETLDLMLLPRRAIMLLLTIFSALALVLAAVGLYGVLAYDVSQRTREIGIRGAIGASRAQIVALILRQGLGKTVLGLTLGLGGAFYLTHFLRKLLFDVSGTDPLTYVGVMALLALVALLASWLPARRAAKVDPVIALRCE